MSRTPSRASHAAPAAQAAATPARGSRAQEHAAERSAAQATRSGSSLASLMAWAPGARLHTDAGADRAARSMNAQAFTVGDDVYFASGQYRPHTTQGRHLLAHELSHVRQQREGGPPRVQCRSWWDNLTDPLPPDVDESCQDQLDESETWARNGPYPAAPQTIIGAAGRGGFDAQYRPAPASGDGVLNIAQSVAVVFKDPLVISGGTVAPHPDLPASADLAARAAAINLLPLPALRAAAIAPYQWAEAEKAPWLARIEPMIEGAWGGQHDFFLNKPRWDWLGASVAVDLNIGERAKAGTDHMTMETYKTPSGESLNTFGIDHEVIRGSDTDAFDQLMRIASTSIDPNSFDLLKREVFFAFGSDTLDATATGVLDRFIARFNGATAHAAHQEIRVDVIGHSSAAGNEAGNLDLSRRRIDAVVSYLRNNGFANVDSRVHTNPRGETEADATDERRAGDQRVDLLVDGGERQVVAIHEFGHAFGLGDEYGAVGTPAIHDAMARKMTDAAGNPLPGAIREHNAGIMASGNEIRPRHYATFHHALSTVTGLAPWSLGTHKAKWQVRMECGWPSPPGDWNLPRRDEDRGGGGGTRSA
jgi:outer membrane protein OmpA-like peptidoglycan-associated protein